ncbi:hypothetical protein HaLaN_04344, partial [Haematococcus lacustris]
MFKEAVAFKAAAITPFEKELAELEAGTL